MFYSNIKLKHSPKIQLDKFTTELCLFTFQKLKVICRSQPPRQPQWYLSPAIHTLFKLGLWVRTELHDQQSIAEVQVYDFQGEVIKDTVTSAWSLGSFTLRRASHYIMRIHKQLYGEAHVDRYCGFLSVTASTSQILFNNHFSIRNTK